MGKVGIKDSSEFGLVGWLVELQFECYLAVATYVTFA